MKDRREELKIKNAKEMWIRKGRKTKNEKGKIKRYCCPYFCPHVNKNYIGGDI
jgi:hypothetical protein